MRGDETDQLFARVEYVSAAAGTYFYLADRMGSVVGLVTQNGDWFKTYSYTNSGALSKFWNNGSIASSTAEVYGYTGREEDLRSGLQYNRNRYYSAKVGRWTSQDPLGFAGGDTNLYRYVNGNPVNYTDPSGLVFNFVTAGVFGFFGAVINVGIYSVTSLVSGQDITWGGLTGAGASGFINGAVIGGTGGLGFLAMGGLGAGSSVVGSVLQQGIDEGFNNINLRTVGISAVSGFAGGMAGGALFNRMGGLAGATLKSSILSGAVAGSVGGFTGGFVGGSTEAMGKGNNWLLGGLKGGAIGAFVGGLQGAAGGAVGYGLYRVGQRAGWIREPEFPGLRRGGPEANLHASRAADVVKQIRTASGQPGKAVNVIVHKDKTVSVGVSGGKENPRLTQTVVNSLNRLFPTQSGPPT